MGKFGWHRVYEPKQWFILLLFITFVVPNLVFAILANVVNAIMLSDFCHLLSNRSTYSSSNF